MAKPTRFWNNTLGYLGRSFRSNRRRRQQFRPRSPRLETLEPRQMLSTFDGTPGDDSIEVSVETQQVRFKDGDWQSYSGDLDIQGNGGTDTLQITGTTADETAVIHPNSGSFSDVGATYTITWSGFTITTIDNHGGDGVAKLYHSAAQGDLFEAAPRYGKLSNSGTGMSNTAEDFKTTRALSTNGGGDTAVFSGSAGADYFEGLWNAGRMNDGMYWIRADAFDNLEVTGGPEDTAVIWDSPGDDQFTAQLDVSGQVGPWTAKEGSPK